MTPGRSVRILGFDGLRALCVIAVYLSHKCELRFYAAQMAVWVFLALSGFLIIGELHKQRAEVERGLYGPLTGMRVFLTKRALRIFPAYYGLLIILMVLHRFYAWAGPDLGFRYHLVYLSNVFFGYVAPSGSPFGVLWTLSVEQQFYVLAPVGFLLLPSQFHLRLCSGIIALAAALHLLMVHAGLPASAIYLTSPWNFAIIAAGGAVGMMGPAHPFVRLLRGLPGLLACIVAMAAYSCVWAIYRTDNPEQPLPLFVVTFALVGLVAWVRINQDSRVVRLLEWRPLQYLGVISYGFYLVHNFVPNPLGRALPLYLGVQADPILTMTLGAALGFCISAFIAHLSWKYYESRILSMRKRLLATSIGTPRRPLPITAIGEDA